MDIKNLKEQLEKILNSVEQKCKEVENKFHVKKPNEVYYHYTSIENAQRILENERISLTHFQDLDDKKEIKGGLKLIQEKIDKEKFQKFYNVFSCIIDNDRFEAEKKNFKTIENINSDLYVFCICEDGDNPKMFNEYGRENKGVSIGFNIEAIINNNELFKNNIELLKNNNEYFPIFGKKVIYDEQQCKKIIDAYLRCLGDASNKLKFLEERNPKNEKTWDVFREYENLLYSLVASYFIPLLAQYKDNSFSHEKEYRFCSLETKFFMKNGEIEYMPEEKIPDTNKHIRVKEKKNIRYITSNQILKDGTIAEIIIGSDVDFEQAKNEFCKLLNEKGFDIAKIKIKKSTVPFRG